MTIDERARRYIARIPPAISGSGGHDQTFTAACALLKGFGLSIDEARPLLLEYNGRCQPPWSGREIEHKLTSAHGAPDAQPRGWLLGEDAGTYQNERPASSSAAPTAPKIVFDPEKLDGFACDWRDMVDLAWLANRSPLEPALFSANDFLTTLYGDGENVLVFTDQRSQGQAVWPAEEIPLAGPGGVWFLAQPVDGQKHPNPRTGRFSRRSEESVTSWRYMVVESDEADVRSWMGALVQLPLQIAAIYTSGKRSIHALVRVDAGSKAAWDRERDDLKEPLIVLGADPKSLSAVRLTRLPGCLRGDKPQRLLYINPAPEPVPTCEMPVLRDAVAHWLGEHLTLLGTVDSLDDPRATPGLLRALEFYARVSPQCRDAAEHWRRKTEGQNPPDGSTREK